MSDRVTRHSIRLFDMWQFEVIPSIANPQTIRVGETLVPEAVPKATDYLLFRRSFNWVAAPDPTERILLRVEGATRDADVWLSHGSSKRKELREFPEHEKLGRIVAAEPFFETDLSGKLAKSNELIIRFAGPAKEIERSTPGQAPDVGYGLQRGVWLLVVDA